MPYLLLADLLVAVHAAFIAWVVLGAFLVWRWPRLAWAHVPAVCWGVGVECTGAICPLTPLEGWLRSQAGEVAFQADFVARYLLPLIYPSGLTRVTQVVIGSAAAVVNIVAYGLMWRRRSNIDHVG